MTETGNFSTLMSAFKSDTTRARVSGSVNGAVRRVMTKAGPRELPTEEHIGEMKRRFAKGNSVGMIAREMGFTKVVVRNRVDERYRLQHSTWRSRSGKGTYVDGATARARMQQAPRGLRQEDFTARFCGDPAVGRRAIDKRASEASSGPPRELSIRERLSAVDGLRSNYNPFGRMAARQESEETTEGGSFDGQV